MSGFSEAESSGSKPSRKLTPKVDNESLIDLGKTLTLLFIIFLGGGDRGII